MSIIIENKEDIELLIEFFKLFNTSNIEAQEDDDLRERVNQIDKWKVEQSDAKKNLAKTLLKVDLRVKKIEEFLDNDVAFVKVGTDATAEEINVPAKATYRQYSKSIYNKMPTLKGMNRDGSFAIGNGRHSKWTIEDILFLKKEIPNLSKSFTELADKLGYSDDTIARLCCAIENGLFDKYFNEWEQIQGDTVYGNWKSTPIINNPQKRRENGMV